MHFIPSPTIYSSLPGFRPLSPTTYRTLITARCYKFHIVRPQDLHTSTILPDGKKKKRGLIRLFMPPFNILNLLDLRTNYIRYFNEFLLPRSLRVFFQSCRGQKGGINYRLSSLHGLNDRFLGVNSGIVAA